MNVLLWPSISNGFVVCLSLMSMAIATPPALSQPLPSGDLRSHAPQPLACSIQEHQLICDLPPRASATSGIRFVPESPRPTAQPSYLLSPSLDKTLANILLGISFIGFPIGLTVAMLWHDKHTAQQQAKLQTQVETLERIWQQSL